MKLLPGIAKPSSNWIYAQARIRASDSPACLIAQRSLSSRVYDFFSFLPGLEMVIILTLDETRHVVQYFVHLREHRMGGNRHQTIYASHQRRAGGASNGAWQGLSKHHVLPSRLAIGPSDASLLKFREEPLLLTPSLYAIVSATLSATHPHHHRRLRLSVSITDCWFIWGGRECVIGPF